MKEKTKIRVLVVDDSLSLRRNIPHLIELDPAIKVVGTAANGFEAVIMAKELRPDVITLDVLMPVMDGIKALTRIMKEAPTRVLMVSSTTYKGAHKTIEAMSLGAVDCIAKQPGLGTANVGAFAKELIGKIKTAAAARIKGDEQAYIAREKFQKIIADLSHPQTVLPRQEQTRKIKRSNIELIGVAASTGGPAALQRVLETLPSPFPAALLIVQHISAGFSEALAERLNSVSPLEIRVCARKEIIQPGVALLAPAGQHLKVIRMGGRLFAFLDDEPADVIHRPSADVLFSSMAETCGANACAVILTGMGDDGAKGIKEIHDRGGFTLAQDEATSLIFGMPKAAIAQGGIDIVSPLERISREILQALG